MPEPPSSTFRPSPRAFSAVAIIVLYADCGTSTIGCSPSMWTLANATFPSFEICRAAAPFANGLSTRSTCGPALILVSVCSIRVFVAGSFTSSAANTTWFVSVDSLLKFLVRRLSAVVDSVPGSENESVKPDPAPALMPPITKRATTQAARTRNLWRKHQRARVVISPTGYGNARSGHNRGDRQRAARPRHRDAVVAVADRVGAADGGDRDGGSGTPRCSASQMLVHRRRTRAVGRNSLSNCAARCGSSVPAIASIGMSRRPWPALRLRPSASNTPSVRHATQRRSMRRPSDARRPARTALPKARSASAAVNPVWLS